MTVTYAPFRYQRMTLATRARFAWLPLLLWVGACAYWTIDKLRAHAPEGPFEWAISGVIYGALFIVGCIGAARHALGWARRARAEGPDTDVPMTWHKRSGTWAVIAIFGGMALMFGIFALIAALIR